MNAKSVTNFVTVFSATVFLGVMTLMLTGAGMGTGHTLIDLSHLTVSQAESSITADDLAHGSLMFQDTSSVTVSITELADGTGALVQWNAGEGLISTVYVDFPVIGDGTVGDPIDISTAIAGYGLTMTTNYIDVEAGYGLDTTEDSVLLDPTEVGTTTWGSGSEITWTFDGSSGTDPTITFGANLITASALAVTDTVFVQEQADSRAHIATWGQGWVKNTDPCTYWFTDDDGNDYQIAPMVAPGSNQQVPYNNNGAFDAEAAFAYDYSNDTLKLGEPAATAVSMHLVVNDASAFVHSVYVGDILYLGYSGITDDYANAPLLFYDTDGQTISVVAPDITTPWTFMLPKTDGDANEFLQTDGAGVTDWVAVTDNNTIRMYLVFTQDGIDADTWAMVDNVTTAADHGYLMMRAGSVTGMSCRIGAALVGMGAAWDVEVFCDSGEIWSDTLSATGDDQECYQTQAAGTDTFTAGQTISVNLNETGDGEVLTSVIVIVEIEYS